MSLPCLGGDTLRHDVLAPVWKPIQAKSVILATVLMYLKTEFWGSAGNPSATVAVH